MKLRPKLFLLLAGVAALPVIAVATLGQREAEAALSRSLDENQIRAAQAEASYVHRYFDELGGELGGALLFGDPSRLDEAKTRELLLRTYLRRDRITVAALVSAQGDTVARFSVEDPSAMAKEEPQTRLHAEATPADLADFEARAKAFVASLSRDRLYAVSEPYLTKTRQRPAVLIAAPPPLGRAHALVVELGLQDLSARLASRFSGDATAFLADERGRVFLHSAEVDVPEGAYRVVPAGTKEAGTVRFDAHGRTLSAGYAPIPELGWVAVVAQPADAVSAPLQALARVSLVVLVSSLLFAGALAFWVAGAFTRPLGALAEGARRLSRGDEGFRIGLSRSDEVGDLARTFDEMGATLLAAKAKLETFNAELQAKVEERTRELKEAQAQVLRSRHLSGLADFAAGFAHEVNNPLTTVLGSAELGLMDYPPGTDVHQLLSAIQKDGQRIATIVRDLQALTDAGKGGRLPLDLNEVSRREVERHRGDLEGEGVAVELSLTDASLPVLAVDGALEDVLSRVLSNARNAVKGRPEKRITLRTATVGGEAVRIEVQDTGCGIPADQLERIFNPFYTTKRDWHGRGVSLALCHRVVEAHGGQLSVQSAVDVGTTVKVVLPVAPPKTFLR